MMSQPQNHTSIFIPDVGVFEVAQIAQGAVIELTNLMDPTNSDPEVVAADEVANGPTHMVSSNALAQIAQGAVIELTNLMDPTNSDPEGGNDGDSSVNINQEGENVPTLEKVIQVIGRAINGVGGVTMAVIVHTAYSKPASGVVFGHNKLAYIAILATIFSLGVGEFITGLWISMSGGIPYRRRLWIAGIVLFLSILLLIGIHIGGFA